MIYKKMFSKYLALSLCISIGFGFIIFGAVFLATQDTGHDVYSQTTGFESRFNILKNEILSSESKEILRVAMAITLFTILSYSFKNKQIFNTSLTFLVFLGFILVLYYSQAVFYNGSWPTGTRYDFPGVLYFPVYIAALVVYIYNVLRILKVPQGLVSGSKAAVIVGFAVIVLMRGFVSTTVALEKSVKRTQEYTGFLERISSQLKDKPNVPIIFESASVLDYEQLYSYDVFLRSFGVKNPFYLKISDYAPLATNSAGLESNLASKLVIISNKGNESFRPLHEFSDISKDCYSIVLSGIHNTSCNILK